MKEEAQVRSKFVILWLVALLSEVKSIKLAKSIRESERDIKKWYTWDLFLYICIRLSKGVKRPENCDKKHSEKQYKGLSKIICYCPGNVEHYFYKEEEKMNHTKKGLEDHKRFFTSDF